VVTVIMYLTDVEKFELATVTLSGCRSGRESPALLISSTKDVRKLLLLIVPDTSRLAMIWKITS